MHDLSALEANESYEDQEWEEEQQAGEADELEFEDEGEDEDEELEEAQELESAAELLSVGSEAELDQFLGSLIRKAAGKLRKGVRAATGNSLGGLLKGLARQALPMVATAIGGPVGGIAARAGLNAATKAFGLELEGLSEEDQELELARRYVRLANGAARRALRQPAAANPRAQAQNAVRWAMQRYAPGMLRRGQRRHHRRHSGGAFPYRDYSGGAACPPCAPCPTCPECGAATPDASDEPATPAAASPETTSEFEFEDEYSGEDEYSAAPAALRGSGGRWVRRGSKIVLYGA